MNRTHRLMFENAVASAIGSQRVIRDGGTEESQVFTLEEAEVQGVAKNLLTWWGEEYEVAPTLETAAADYFDKIYCPHGGEREDENMTGFAREFYASFANRAVDLLRELREDTAFVDASDGIERAARDAAGALQRLLTELSNEGLLTVEVRDPFEE